MNDKNYEKVGKKLCRSKVKNKSPHRKARKARSKRLLGDADFLEGCKHSVSDVSDDVKGDGVITGRYSVIFCYSKLR